MRRSVRLLGLAAVVATAGLTWTFLGQRDVQPEPQTEYAVEQPVGSGERAAPRMKTGVRPSGNPAGLPARGTRSAKRSFSAAAAPAAVHAAPTSSAPAPASPSMASSAANGVRRAGSAVTPLAELASQPTHGGDAPAPPDEERPRSLGISGSVLEKGGAPAAGVRVRLAPRRLFNGASPASSPLQATTDGRGNFTFGAVADGEYEIATEKNERYERGSTLARAGAEAVVLVVEPIPDGVISIRGVVESANSGVLEGVRVQVIGEANLAATTDAKGAYAIKVPAGARAEQTALQFRRAGFRDRRWAMADGVRSNQYEVIANVRLDPDTAGVSVTGVVTSTNGAPVARAQVQLNSAARGRSYRAVSEADGRFTLANVEPGADYRLWARAEAGFKDRVLDNVTVDAAIAPIDVELSPVGVATLRARMVSPDGAPVPGFTMFLTTAYGGGPRTATVTGDGQGRFVVNDLPEGPIALQTRAAPVISVSGIELSANSSAGAEATVVVDVGAHRFEGRVLMSDGSPAPAIKVSLEWSGSMKNVTSRSSRETITDGNGNFAFTQLGTGIHALSATVAGTGSVRVDHFIGPGTAPVQIVLPARRGTQ
ncbi:MAG TPA: carboxypeptidase-like regulatory domain-containing protein [Vicinamibacterales bacterium]|nr:carboxypeptidase-like regulatory domain-containing protein [Vicinamibacterales bacterium]